MILKLTIFLLLLCVLSDSTLIRTIKGPIDFCQKRIFFIDWEPNQIENFGYANNRGDVLYIQSTSWDNFRCSPDGKYLYRFYPLFGRIYGYIINKIDSGQTPLKSEPLAAHIDYEGVMAVSANGNVYIIIEGNIDDYDSITGEALSGFIMAEYDSSLTLLDMWEIPFVTERANMRGFTSLNIDSDGRYYIAYKTDTDEYLIEKFATDKTSLGILPFNGKYVTVNDEMVFVSSNDGVIAYDPTTYNILWSKSNYANQPLAVSNNELVTFIEDGSRMIVLKTLNGKVKFKWGSDPNLPRSLQPRGIGVRPDGNVVTNNYFNQVLMVNPSGKIKSKITVSDTIDALVLSPYKNQMYIQHTGNNIVQRYAANGNSLNSFTLTPNLGLSCDRNGDLITFQTSGDYLVSHYKKNGDLIISKKIGKVSSVATDSNGNFYILKKGSNYVFVFNKNLKLKRNFGGISPLFNPVFVAIDDADRVYIIDIANDGVHVYSTAGDRLFSFAGNELYGTSNKPFYLAVTPEVDGLKRFIYVVSHDQVLKYNYSGKYLTRWFS